MSWQEFQYSGMCIDYQEFNNMVSSICHHGSEYRTLVMPWGLSSQNISGQLLSLHSSRDINTWNSHNYNNSSLVWDDSLKKFKAMKSGGGTGDLTQATADARYAGSSNVNRSLINSISSNLDTRVDSLFNFSSNKSLYPASSMVNRGLINSISSNLDIRVDSIFSYSSNAKSLYAGSSQVSGRFYPSALGSEVSGSVSRLWAWSSNHAANWLDLTDGGETNLHSHTGGGGAGGYPSGPRNAIQYKSGAGAYHGGNWQLTFSPLTNRFALTGGMWVKGSISGNTISGGVIRSNSIVGSVLSQFAGSTNIKYRFPGSSNLNKTYVDTISGNIRWRFPGSANVNIKTSGSLHNLWNWSANKSWYANSANVRFRFQASSLAYASYKHSANTSLHSFTTANYMTSANAISRFKYSSGVWGFASSQKFSGGTIITNDLTLNANTISGLVWPLYPSAAVYRHYIDVISGALDAKIDAVGGGTAGNYIYDYIIYQDGSDNYYTLNGDTGQADYSISNPSGLKGCIDYATNALSSVGGGRIFIEAGNYKFNGRITIPCDNIEIDGAGSEHTKIYTYSGQIYSADKEKIKLKGFSISGTANIYYQVGSSSNPIGGLHLEDIYLWMISSSTMPPRLFTEDVRRPGFCIYNNTNIIKDLIIKDCTLKTTFSHGISFYGVNHGTIKNVVVDNCRFYRCGYNISGLGSGTWGAGLILSHDPNIDNIRVTNCYASGCWSTGFYMEQGCEVRNLVYENCKAENCGVAKYVVFNQGTTTGEPAAGQGFGFGAFGNTKITNCTSVGNRKYGIRLLSDTNSKLYNYPVVENCYIDGKIRSIDGFTKPEHVICDYGIRVDNPHSIVKNNTIYCASTAIYCGAKNTLLDGNTITVHPSSAYGIYMNAIRYNITNNFISGGAINDRYGIRTSNDSDEGQVTNNTILGNTSQGYTAGILMEGKYNVISENYISGGNTNGILLETTSRHNKILNNRVIGASQLINDDGSGNRLVGNVGKNGKQISSNMLFTKKPNANDYPGEILRISGGTGIKTWVCMSVKNDADTWEWIQLGIST